MPYKDKNKANANKRASYARNRDRELARTKKRKRKLAKFISKLKEGQVCKCGEDHPACLVFHHRNPEEKEFEIALSVRNGYSEVRIANEVKKCDLICSNCHLKLHWEENTGTYYR